MNHVPQQIHRECHISSAGGCSHVATFSVCWFSGWQRIKRPSTYAYSRQESTEVRPSFEGILVQFRSCDEKEIIIILENHLLLLHWIVNCCRQLILWAWGWRLYHPLFLTYKLPNHLLLRTFSYKTMIPPRNLYVKWYKAAWWYRTGWCPAYPGFLLDCLYRIGLCHQKHNLCKTNAADYHYADQQQASPPAKLHVCQIYHGQIRQTSSGTKRILEENIVPVLVVGHMAKAGITQVPMAL